jgi:hypothetical protein
VCRVYGTAMEEVAEGALSAPEASSEVT